MVGSETTQMFAEHPRTASRDAQMMDSRGRFEINPVTCIPPPIRKLSFKIIGDSNESLVKTANFEGDIAPYRKISRHKLCDQSWPTACKVEPIVARKINSFLPRLDDAASHEARVGLLVSIGVRLNKPWFRSDIVVEEKHDLVLRLN